MTELQIANRLKWFYYGAMILAVAAAGLCYYLFPKYGLYVDPYQKAGMAISYVVICYMLASVAGGLWWFNRKIKPLKKREDEGRYEEYIRYAVIRLCIIGLGLVLAIVAYYLLKLQTMIYCAAISAVGLVFCKPQEGKIQLDLIDDGD